MYSESATELNLLILNQDDPSQLASKVPLVRGEAGIWHAESASIKPGIKYALQADGPAGPRDGFKPDVRLIDPYAKAVERVSAREYYCVAIEDDFDWENVAKPKIPLSEAVIYEAHARGLTRGNTNLPDDLRGTYAALGHPETISHLKKIGVTSVELLPIHMFISEPRLMNMGLINYWGYNTINFFSPHPRYATEKARAAGPLAVVNELKSAIRELHRNDIEVILDVVYNHTAEGGGGGLTYSYRGLDNSNYYRQDDRGWYQDTTGCGNSLNFSNPAVVKLTLDSLAYWTEVMQIDGFRFDLATTLARDENNSFDPNHPVLQGIISDSRFADSKMIVEPWDVGIGGWQTGNFPDRFSEWNDHFRDSVRRFWLSDVAAARDSGRYWNGVADLATRLAGSQDIVPGPTGPLGSVNFITAHDGFTLHDLVSYNVKHNQVNGESNRDGSTNNHSFNFGFEGETNDPGIRAARRRAMRNLTATLLFSAGIPMITAGDERGKTQLGNNNAYCQDSQLSWVNWDLNRSELDVENTFAYLTKLRSEHPALRPTNFGSFERLETGLDRIRWFNADGHLMSLEDWDNPEVRTVARYTEHDKGDGSFDRLLLVVHGSEIETKVVLPIEIEGLTFELLWDSALETPPDRLEKLQAQSTVLVTGTSMQLYRVS
ncbi:MAG: hypothetical protein RL670_1270 [Actinomycetota bacterium]